MSKKMKGLESLGGLVYSTNPNYQQPSEEDDSTPIEPKDQDLRIWLEKNHRGGKTASVVRGFIGSQEALEQLAKKLKNQCGTGGSAKDGEIIIQGDHRDKMVKLLVQEGYRVKKAGA
ncbi:MAG: translation initiation factor [Flavobacteriales bacterium]